MSNHKVESWPAIVTAVMSFVAILDLPYGYYQVLRFVVCIAAIYYLYKSYKHDSHLPVRWLAVGIAILFNPIAPIHLDRSIWVFLNVATGIYFATIYRTIKRHASNPTA